MRLGSYVKWLNELHSILWYQLTLLRINAKTELLFRNYHSFNRCFVSERAWHDMVQTCTKCYHSVYRIIHTCCGLIYSLNGLICALETLNHPPKSFTLFVTRQHMIRDICQSMALFWSHRRLLSPFWNVFSTLYSSCHAACQCCKIR